MKTSVWHIAATLPTTYSPQDWHTPGHPVIHHFLNPPNWFTSASIFCSVYAMSMLVGSGDPEPATLVTAASLIIFAGVFDLLDGRVARMTNRMSEFGVQLDSIADTISFGVAPALLVWAWALNDLGILGALVTFFYVLCVAFRLARFNVDAAHDTWPLPGHSRGLTSTMSGGILVVFVWMGNGYLSEVISFSPWVVAGVMLFQSLLMVSSIPYRSFRDVRRNLRARITLAAALLACVMGAITLDYSLFFGIGAFLYLFWGLADGLVTAAYYRRIGRALPDDEEELAALREVEEAEVVAEDLRG